MRVIKRIDGPRAAIGEDLGVSDWELLDQAAIDRFAEATGDDYFIHTDPQRAKEEAGLDSTIAHGLLTHPACGGCGSTLTYGYDKVRASSGSPE